MKPEIAIVRSATAQQDAAVDAAWSAYKPSREEYGKRRLALGEALIARRRSWPRSGPRARGWGEYLAARGIDQDVALDAMKYAGYVEANPPVAPGELPTPREAGIDRRPLAADRDVKPSNVPQLSLVPEPAPAQLTEEQLFEELARLAPEAWQRIRKRMRAANMGGTGDEARGDWCTPKKWAAAVGPWDLDPFSNPRSHIVAADRCMLEDGGDGLVIGEPGSYRVGAGGPVRVAGPHTRMWWQPPYQRGFIERVIAHYKHTRFCALLRWAPDTEWFELLWPLVKVVAFPIGERIDFEPPPGVPESSTPHAHAFHYSDPRDVTPAIAERCIVLTRNEALRLVR